MKSTFYLFTCSLQVVLCKAFHIIGRFKLANLLKYLLKRFTGKVMTIKIIVATVNILPIQVSTSEALYSI